MIKKITTKDFIGKSMEVDSNKYDYSLDNIEKILNFELCQ